MRPRHRTAGDRAVHLHAVPDLPDEGVTSVAVRAPAAQRTAEIPVGRASTGCRCAHVRLAHEHFRRGTDCALCDCVRFVALTHHRVAALRA